MKIALITGISKGLGEGLAKILLERNYRVTGLGRNDNPNLNGGHYRFVSLDLKKPDKIKTIKPLLQEMANEQPESILLISNAGVHGACGAIGELDEDKVLETFNVNLLSPVLLSNVFTDVFAPLSLHKRILNVSSAAANSPIPGGSTYCQTKAGVEILTRVMFEEQKNKPYPIEVIAIRPGRLDTPMQAELRHLPNLPMGPILRKAYEDGALKDPLLTAREIVEKFVDSPIESGTTYTLE